MEETENLTPLLKQYQVIKNQHPDALLLFRMGDFYETFGDDAKYISKVLDIILTKRKTGEISHTYLAGFEHTKLDLYLPMLIKAGQRVAICEQLEDPKGAEEIKREVEPYRDLFA